MNKFFHVFIFAIVIFIIIFILQFNIFDENNDVNKKILDIDSLFIIYGIDDDYTIFNDRKIWNTVEFELNPNNNEIYSSLFNDKNTVVISPIFTANAYSENGFYEFFKGKCDQTCLTIELEKIPQFIHTSSGNALQVLSLLNYQIISDIDVDKNPDILKNYDKVILLHNEYVTKKEFDAITSHPNVIYLYPNALYAEISVNYEDNTMTLIRGHNYPEPEILNGFDWEYDNSPLEYDENCISMGFDKISNGWMLNCYPERAIHQSKILLEMIKTI